MIRVKRLDGSIKLLIQEDKIQAFLSLFLEYTIDPVLILFHKNVYVPYEKEVSYHESVGWM